MSGTRTRPNTNPILGMMRDDDFSDPWGTAMAWAGAVCDVLYDADPNSVPPELGYRPGMGGPEVPGQAWADGGHMTGRDVPYETCMVWEYLHGIDSDPETSAIPYWLDPSALPYWSDPTFEGRHAELVTAARCLSRYLDWLQAAGKSY